ncbi:NAD(P)-dependent alcohol dehydrogenase [uncultured Cohaesibacter sp.]|uniref:NAD(P)-dependent alcohol dehydrogenase n=1 Tax=uncultured Cohaesibacter sp. TaxID=1002546 RepID=UPI0029C75EEE|nr:NAD(P)-dependent alcohol dehydrogenase [uncultured Cohaesibacter sp.]
MKALYLESIGNLSIRDFQEEMVLGDADLEIEIKRVGICASDVHYYTHGRIGQFIVEKPMVLGHEAAGIVKRVGSSVTDFKVGDRVCMEPGIPDFKSKTALIGKYNLDPTLTFWATPPIHGCMRETVIHPSCLTFKLPDHVSFGEGAMIEPLSIGMQVATMANFKPGDIALVMGCGTIGLMCALSALAGGCAKVMIADLVETKLDIARRFDGLVPVNITKENLEDVVMQHTGGWGADVVMEASGSAKVYPDFVKYCAPAGKFVIAGIPSDPVPIDIAQMLTKEVNLVAINRYCNVYDRAVNLVASGKIDVASMIGKVYDFDDSIEAYEYVAKGGSGEVKVQISLE